MVLYSVIVFRQHMFIKECPLVARKPMHGLDPRIDLKFI